MNLKIDLIHKKHKCVKKCLPNNTPLNPPPLAFDQHLHVEIILYVHLHVYCVGLADLYCLSLYRIFQSPGVGSL